MSSSPLRSSSSSVGPASIDSPPGLPPGAARPPPRAGEPCGGAVPLATRGATPLGARDATPLGTRTATPAAAAARR
jgi:hypothetical protein